MEKRSNREISNSLYDDVSPKVAVTSTPGVSYSDQVRNGAHSRNATGREASLSMAVVVWYNHTTVVVVPQPFVW